MNKLRELPPLKESNEITVIDGQGVFSSELTRQEADDKVAALIEECQTIEHTKKLDNEQPDIGDGKIAELSRLKSDADNALSKWDSLDKELKTLKSRRDNERDAAKKSTLIKKVDAKQSEVDRAKRDYENKKSLYQAYARRL